MTEPAVSIQDLRDRLTGLLADWGAELASVLKELEGMRYPEIAAVLGIPEGTVASRLFHARRALRTALDDLGVVYP